MSEKRPLRLRRCGIGPAPQRHCKVFGVLYSEHLQAKGGHPHWKGGTGPVRNPFRHSGEQSTRSCSGRVPSGEGPLRRHAPGAPSWKGQEAEYVLFSGELPGGKLYRGHELGILRSLLRQAKLLYENAWLYEEEKKHLSEKEKIFRDLHDGIGGIMS